MRIGFIGAGKVGTAFGRYLSGRGATVSGYYGIHPDKVRNACAATGGRAFESSALLARGSDLVLITTRDDQIAEACAELCATDAVHEAHLVGHMSGAHASTILSPAADKGAATFSLHPLQSFAQEEKSLENLPLTFFSLEGKDARLSAVEHLLGKIGNPFFKIAPENKALYHLSACVFSNYLVTLMDFGLKILEQAGVPRQQGFTAMLPLIQGTIANIDQIGAQRALTGPIARGDTSTLADHLSALDQKQMNRIKDLYVLLGRETLDLAAKDVLDNRRKIEAVRNLFNSPQQDQAARPSPYKTESES